MLVAALYEDAINLVAARTVATCSSLAPVTSKVRTGGGGGGASTFCFLSLPIIRN